MSTLSTCVKRAGKALSKDDADAIKVARDELIADGMEAQPAAIEAVYQYLTELRTERTKLAEALGAGAGSYPLTAMTHFDKRGIDAAANEAATSPTNDLAQPTDAQKEAGNYQKGHITIQGLDITIENPKGSTRSGTAPDGSTWNNTMDSHYGYIKRTNGADGDQVDVYVGPNPEAGSVFIVDQVSPDGSFDEHKVMIGFDTQAAAEKGYLSNYSKGWKLGPITPMSMEQFKGWLNSGATALPLQGAAIDTQKADKLFQASQARKKKDYGSENKLVTADRAQELRDKIRAKLGTLNSGIDPEMLAIGAELAVFHIEAGARKFADLAAAIANDLGVSVAQIRPYLRSWYNGARDMMEDNDLDISGMDSSDQVSAELKSIPKESSNAERKPIGSESNSGDRQNEESATESDLSDDGRGSGRPGADEAGEAPGADAGGYGASLDMFGPANAGKHSDQPLYSDKSRLEDGAPRDTDDPGSRPDSTGGLFAERDTDAEANQLVEKTPAVITPAKKTLDKHKPADLEQIKAQMPFLTNGQAEDVVFAEARLAKPDGFGVLFTNGTGTGKTFTGLGIAKRMADQGKGRILIAVPKQPIADAWKEAGKKFFGLDISSLESVTDSGKGIVVTTYANLGMNKSLIDQGWDGFFIDEAHYLSSNQVGADTLPLDMLRALGGKRNTSFTVVEARFPDLNPRRAELRELIKDYSRSQAESLRAKVHGLQAELDALDSKYSAELDKAKAELAATKDADKPRAVFLSATPFAYEKSVQWANEWLFDWGTDEKVPGYNSGNEYDKFMMTHFGYRMRYNKLTEPDAKVDRGLMQRTFNTWLKKEGVLSGRALDSDFDYDRLFVIADSAIGRRVDDALEWLREQGSGKTAMPGMREIHDKIAKDNFDYQSRMYFLEAIKAKEAVGHIKEHLALGRKVIVFHDYKKGGATNPFHISPNPGDEAAAYQRFVSEFSDLIRAFDVLPSPIDQLTRSFPDALVYNGSVTSKNRIKMQDQFNSDAPGSPRIMIAQSDAAREGISLHDTTSKHPRTSINLGMPAKPTATIQLEGRTYRTGQASNAMFRYFTIGTNWERYAFASKIAVRADAADNLAMGELARGLKNAFISAYEEADSYPAGFDGEGTGGKEKDKSFAGSMTPWDMAKSFYFGTKKQGSGRAARGREGVDYFATPEPVGLKMMQLADMRGGESALEPSAGHGAIARWFPENVEGRAIEFEDSLASKLALHFDGKVETGDFMQHNIVNKYDSIVMNPPFGAGGADARDHVAKAIKHLRDGGRIVALIPTGPAADAKLEKLLFGDDAAPNIYLAAEIQLPSITFERAGTAVRTRILVLEKQADATLAAKIQQTNRDYSDVETVADLFDRMENMEIKPRVKPVIEEEDISPVPMKDQRPTAAPPAPGQTGGIETWEAKHSQTGADLYMAKAKDKVSRDQYQAMAAVAKQHGGYWSRFGKAGFLFKTEENRKAFVDAMNGSAGAFRATTTPAGKVTVADVQAVADKLGANWGSKVHIIQTSAELPETAQVELLRQGITSEVTGYYDRKNQKVYLVAGAMRNKQEAQVTLLHEAVGHLGIEKVMGEEINVFLKSVYDARNSDPAIKKAWDYVNQESTYGNADVTVQASEIIARLAESDPKHTMVQRFFQLVRQALRKMGFNIVFSNNDIIEALYRAKRALENGSYAGEGSQGGLFQAAYHGSPHRHNRFSTDKIGTGEGTQAYGWGLYFAQKREVAEYYKNLPHKNTELAYKNKPIGSIKNEWSVVHSKNIFADINQSGRSFSEAKQYALRDLDYQLQSARNTQPSNVRPILEAITFIGGIKDGDIAQANTLYTVDVPEDHELLDWDAPLVEQTSILKNLKPVIAFLEKKGYPINVQTVTGEQLYNRLVGEMHLEHGAGLIDDAPKMASLALAAEGIPGLRFFDHMSRHKAPDVPEFTAWAGYYKGVDLATASDSHMRELRAEYQEFVDQEDTRTRNFVIFDEDRVEITDTLFRVAEEMTEHDLYAFEAEITEKYGLESFFLNLSRDQETITLANFVVPKGKQKQGQGSAAMRELTNFADKYGKTLFLEPALPDDRKGTTSRARLVRFYKRFGFVENKGRNKDFTYRGGMYRSPQASGGQFRVADDNGKGSPAWEAAKAKGLDMSKAARMKRAEEMGFDTDTVWYHGTPTGGFDEFSVDKQGSKGGHARGGFSFTTDRNAAFAYAEGFSEETNQIDSIVERANKIFLRIDASKMSEEDRDWLSLEDGEPLEWYWGAIDDVEDALSGLGDIAGILDNSDQAGIAQDLRAIMADTPVFAPEVKEVYLRLGDNSPIYSATRETLGNVVVGLDVREVPDRAAVVHMDDGSMVAYVADPESIRSINAAFDPAESKSGNILFRVAEDQDPEEGARRPFRATLRDRIDKYRFEMQDKLIDLKRIQEDADPSDDANAYQKASIWEGKAGERIHDFDEGRVQPLLTAIARTGMEWDEVGKWLVARHAREANAYLAEINLSVSQKAAQIAAVNARRTELNDQLTRARAADPHYGNQQSYQATVKLRDSLAGVLAAIERREALPDADHARLSGMSNEEAAEILDRHSNNAAVWEVGSMVDRINQERVDMLIEDGLITRDMAGAWQGRYQHYVPLKREEAEDGDHLPSRGRGFNIKGKESKMRTGSAHWTPGKIVSNVLAQYESSIVRAEKNKVGLALLKFVEQHPDESFWNIDTERTEKYVRNGQVVEGPKGQDAVHELSVKRDGVPHYISFVTSNEKAMRLVKGLKNLQAAEMGSVMRGMATVTRFLATINTSWSPEFMISNFARDIQTAAYNITSTDVANMRSQVLKDVPAAMNGIRSALFGDGSSEWAPIWEDFRKAGGKTGWLDIHNDVKEKEKDLKKMAERIAQGKPALGRVKRFVKKVEDANNVIENGVRLAAYKAALDAGLSKDRAAALAKDLTVNFNRKGNKGPQINALYMFFNAAVQGNVRLIQTMATSKQGRNMAYATIGFAIALDMINRSLSGDDDDGQNIYDNLPSYLKDRNILIMGEDGVIAKIPAPWGYNVLHVFGQVIGQAITGEISPLEGGARVGMGIMDAFNPLSSGTLLQMAAPTVLDPIAQMSENKNFAGTPLKPEHTFDSRSPVPEYQMHWASSREASQAIAKFANDATGGNEIRPGAINVSPEWIDLIVDTLTGGLGQTAANTLDTVTRLASGKELPVENIPFLRKVAGYNNENAVKGRYYEWSKGVAYAKSELKGLRGEDLADARKNPEFHMIGLYTATEKKLTAMRKMRRQMEERGSSEESIDKLDDRIRAVMARFNEAYAAKVLK